MKLSIKAESKTKAKKYAVARWPLAEVEVVN